MRLISTICLNILPLVLIVDGQAQPRPPDSLFHALNIAKSQTETVRALINISKWNLGNDYPSASRFADSALFVSKESEDEALIAMASTIRALVFWHNGEYESSIATYQSALAIQERLNNIDEMGVNYHGIAMNYYYKADYHHALSFHERALECFKQTGNKAKQLQVLNHTGLVYRQMGAFPKAIEYLLESSRIQRELPGYTGRINRFTGDSPFSKLNDYWERQLTRQLADLERERESGHGRNIVELLYNVADTYNELGDQVRSLEYFRKAMNYSTSIGRGVDYFRLGEAYRKLGQIDSAIATHQKALPQAKRFGTRISYMWAHQLLGDDYFAAGRFEESLQYYQASLSMTAEMGNKLDVIKTLQRMANVYAAMDQTDRAITVLNESLALAKKVGAREQLRDGYLAVAALYAQQEQHRLAYQNQLLGKTLADSLTHGEADLQFAEMQVQYESDRKAEDIAMLNQEKLIQDAKIRNKDLLIVGSIVVLCLLTLLAISTYRRFRHENEARLALQKQKEHIEILLAEIHHRVKNNLQVISSLLSIQSSQLKSRSARMAVLEGQSRVYAMGLIHENIYRGENFTFIQMEEYLRKLGDTILSSFRKRNIELAVNASGLSVDVDTAIPLGLIINELLTNSLKHAFKGVANPCVNVHLSVDEAGHLWVEVSDNGCGTVDVDTDHSFGLRLVKELTSQLAGKFEITGTKGFQVRIMITRFKLAA